MYVGLVEESFRWKQLKSEKDKQKLRRKKKSSRDGSKKGSFISVWNVLNALNNLNLPCILNILISSKIEIPQKIMKSHNFNFGSWNHFVFVFVCVCVCVFVIVFLVEINGDVTMRTDRRTSEETNKQTRHYRATQSVDSVKLSFAMPFPFWQCTSSLQLPNYHC